jgi:hypothetical protein
MENQITCPQCKRTITNNPVVDSAASGAEHTMGSEYVVCDLILGDYSPTAQSKETRRKSPALVSQLLQELIVGAGPAERWQKISRIRFPANTTVKKTWSL